jgi:hypothetical protein
MPNARSDPLQALPPWLIVLGSAAVAAHLAAVVVLVLAAPSGPWPSPFGGSMAEGPEFARGLSTWTTRYYLAPLKMTHNYHFLSNRPGPPGAAFEVRLKDEGGRHLGTVRIPDPGANFWVRHRQGLLAQALADDRPVRAGGSEVVAAPGRPVPVVAVWVPGEDGMLRVRPVPEHLVPRDRPVFRPSEWSLVLARSYVRHLCRVYGAAAGELVRHTREPVPPAVLSGDEQPPDAFVELLSNFGELPR